MLDRSLMVKSTNSSPSRSPPQIRSFAPRYRSHFLPSSVFLSFQNQRWRLQERLASGKNTPALQAIFGITNWGNEERKSKTQQIRPQETVFIGLNFQFWRRYISKHSLSARNILYVDHQLDSLVTWMQTKSGQYRAFSHIWPASIQIQWNKRKRSNPRLVTVP